MTRWILLSQPREWCSIHLQNMTLCVWSSMELSDVATSSLEMKLTGPQTSCEDVNISNPKIFPPCVRFAYSPTEPPPATAPRPSDDALAMHAAPQNLVLFTHSPLKGLFSKHSCIIYRYRSPTPAVRHCVNLLWRGSLQLGAKKDHLIWIALGTEGFENPRCSLRS